MNFILKALPKALTLHALVCLVVAGVTPPATAHDTWFERVDTSTGDSGQPLVLALGSGTQYPVYETPVQPKFLTHFSCADNKGLFKPDSVRAGRRHTVVRVPGVDVKAFSCEMSLQSFEVELAPELVDTYFAEIRASDALRAVLAGQRAKGRAFEERYLKFARFDGPLPPIREKHQAMDVLRVTPRGLLQVGSDTVYEVRRDNKPLPHLPVQLVHEGTPTGHWLRTDSSGRIAFRLPLSGRWLLRAVDLRPPISDDARWESRFIAYTFEVAP